jgi:peptidoglycan/LPS O-acetylase OafA/YrhL
MTVDERLARHRRRQGAILLLLLLGPTPIALALFALGTSPLGLGSVLAATAALIGTMLELYRRQRRDAAAAGLHVLPKAHVVLLLVMVGAIAAGTFLAPTPELAPYGLAALGLALAAVYGLAAAVRRTIDEPDERCAVMVLGLMASLIALAGSCL